MTIDELRVLDRFLIEAVCPKYKTNKLDFAIAYVAVEDSKNIFKPAIEIVDFFLLLHSLVTGEPVTFKTGIGTELWGNIVNPQTTSQAT